MRPKLLKSFIVVLAFWLGVTTLYWSLQQPEENIKALAAIKAMLPFLPIQVPQSASVFSSLSVQTKVFTYWSIPVLALAVISSLIGYGFIWLLAKRKADERTDRETGSGNFRGVTLTVGELPMPAMLPKHDIDLGSDDDSLGRMTEKERKLLADILGTISAAGDAAYAGEGITVSLLEHTLNLAAKALTHQRYPGLSALVAAAHEMGKITSYSKNAAGEWSRVKNHDREAARILGTMDSWYALPAADRNAVLMAVKFHSNPRQIPDLEGDQNVHRYARDLLAVADGAQTEAVIEEKQRTLEKTELPDVIFNAFAQALPSLSFQNRGLPKGVAAVAWKIGTRVYLLEIKLRETVMAKLPSDVRGALTPAGKERQRVQPFTAELLKALESRGWLVSTLNDVHVEPKEALWNIKAGKLDFKGVIVIDVPAEFMSQLPSDDSMYEIVVTGPLFIPGAHQGGMGLSKNDLLGSVLRPSANKPEQPPV